MHAVYLKFRLSLCLSPYNKCEDPEGVKWEPAVAFFACIGNLDLTGAGIHQQ